jgi:hypothetical protein
LLVVFVFTWGRCPTSDKRQGTRGAGAGCWIKKQKQKTKHKGGKGQKGQSDVPIAHLAETRFGFLARDKAQAQEGALDPGLKKKTRRTYTYTYLSVATWLPFLGYFLRTSGLILENMLCCCGVFELLMQNHDAEKLRNGQKRDKRIEEKKTTGKKEKEKGKSFFPQPQLFWQTVFDMGF